MEINYVTPSCTVLALGTQELICTSVDNYNEQTVYEF